MKGILFGTGGIPLSTKKPDTVSGIERINELQLDAMELEFVYGVRMSKETALTVKDAMQKNKVALTVHGPYYINLSSAEDKKIEASINRILAAARIGELANATHLTFHPGFYGKYSKEKTYDIIKNSLKIITNTLKEEKIRIKVCLETTGKKSQFGSIDEILELSKELPVFPTVDFAHVHARGNGLLKSKKEFQELLSSIKSHNLHKDLHMHAAGINYSEKGERNHLNLLESDFKWKLLLECLKENDFSGILICESPNLEEDAVMMKNYYSSI